MIKIGCNDFDITDSLNSLNCDNPYMCRIMSVYNAYGANMSFSDFWCQYDDKNKVSSAVCRIDNQVTLYTTENSDIAEIADFIAFLKPFSILCDDSIGLKLDSYSKQSGMVLKYNSDSVKNKSEQSIKVIKNPDIKKLYILLKSTDFENFTNVDFESFYLDLSHKIRHSCARAYAVFDGDKIISCAVVPFETQDCAIINAVATDINYRRKGIASSLLKSIISELQSENKSIYIYREMNKNTKFYKGLNFCEKSVWSEYIIREQKSELRFF
ncbi:MAG: GNAT family N-acetyltransferase [Acutalibacteraceae bacterium]